MSTIEIGRFRPLAHSIIWSILVLISTVTGCAKSNPKDNNQPVDPSIPKVHPMSFDEHGQMLSKNDLAALIKEAKDTGVTDIFILAHGWNTSSTDAMTAYTQLTQNTHEASLKNPDLRPSPYKPMVIGLVWPSRAWDYGPSLESSDPVVPLTVDQKEALEESMPVSALKENSPVSKTSETVANERSDDLMTLTELLKKKKSETTAMDRKKAFAIFQKYSIKPSKMKYATPDDQNRFDKLVPEGVTELSEVLFPSLADAARVFTFWQMKKRAGLVGENGGAQVLPAIATSVPGCRIHLFGHSFGTKLHLSSVLAAANENPAVKVDTMVLFQGAVSYQAFSDQVALLPVPTPGGYRNVQKAVKGPIVATFTTKDLVLRYAYPLGARLGGEVGELAEMDAAAVSPYSALGAVGFDHITSLTMTDTGKTYGFKNDPKLFSIASSNFISGHGDLVSPAVAWLAWSAAVRN